MGMAKQEVCVLNVGWEMARKPDDHPIEPGAHTAKGSN